MQKGWRCIAAVLRSPSVLAQAKMSVAISWECCFRKHQLSSEREMQELVLALLLGFEKMEPNPVAGF